MPPMPREPKLLATPTIYTGERRPGPPPALQEGPMPVTIIDVRMPFFSLMWLLVKLALAAIPATIILAVLWALLVGSIGSVIHSLGQQWTTSL